MRAVIFEVRYGFTLRLDFSQGSGVKKKQMERLTLSSWTGCVRSHYARAQHAHVCLKKPLCTN